MSSPEPLPGFVLAADIVANSKRIAGQIGEEARGFRRGTCETETNALETPLNKRRKVDGSTKEIMQEKVSEPNLLTLPEEQRFGGSLPATPTLNDLLTAVQAASTPVTHPHIDLLPNYSPPALVDPTTNAPPSASTVQQMPTQTLVTLLQPLSEPPLVPHIRARRAPTSYRRRKPQQSYPAAKPPYLIERPAHNSGTSAPSLTSYRIGLYNSNTNFPAFLQQVTPRNQVTAGEAHRNPVSARFVDRRWWIGGGANTSPVAAPPLPPQISPHLDTPQQWPATCIRPAFSESSTLHSTEAQLPLPGLGVDENSLAEPRDLLGMLLLAANGEA